MVSLVARWPVLWPIFDLRICSQTANPIVLGFSKPLCTSQIVSECSMKYSICFKTSISDHCLCVEWISIAVISTLYADTASGAAAVQLGNEVMRPPWSHFPSHSPSCEYPSSDPPPPCQTWKHHTETTGGSVPFWVYPPHPAVPGPPWQPPVPVQWP